MQKADPVEFARKQGWTISETPVPADMKVELTTPHADVALRHLCVSAAQRAQLVFYVYCGTFTIARRRGALSDAAEVLPPKVERVIRNFFEALYFSDVEIDEHDADLLAAIEALHDLLPKPARSSEPSPGLPWLSPTGIEQEEPRPSEVVAPDPLVRAAASGLRS